MKTKTRLVTFKASPTTYNEFKAAAEVLGSNMSNLLHQHATKVIGQVRKEEPEKFEKTLAEVWAKEAAEEEAKTKKAAPTTAPQLPAQPAALPPQPAPSATPAKGKKTTSGKKPSKAAQLREIERNFYPGKDDRLTKKQKESFRDAVESGEESDLGEPGEGTQKDEPRKGGEE